MGGKRKDDEPISAEDVLSALVAGAVVTQQTESLSESKSRILASLNILQTAISSDGGNSELTLQQKELFAKVIDDIGSYTENLRVTMKTIHEGEKLLSGRK